MTLAVRRLIVERGLRPGEAIPTRQQLAADLCVSLTSVHRGVGVLIGQGFLTADRRRGTRVAPGAPHLARYAVVFQELAHKIFQSPFLSAIYSAATSLPELAPRTFRLFAARGLADTPHPPPAAAMAEADGDRLAGLLLVGDAGYLGQLGLEEAARRLPVAAFGSFAPRHDADALISYDQPSFFDRAMGAVRAGGFRRAAVILGGYPSGAEAGLAEAVERHGVVCPPEWRQYTLLAVQDTPVRNLVRLLMAGPRSRRPQALVVGDDSLSAAVCRQLQALGFEPGRSPLVVSQTNYPQPYAPDLPVRWLGFDAHEWFRAAVEALEARRPGAPVLTINLPSRFPEEVEAAHLRARSLPAAAS